MAFRFSTTERRLLHAMCKSPRGFCLPRGHRRLDAAERLIAKGLAERTQCLDVIRITQTGRDLCRKAPSTPVAPPKR
jgi:hypothetical protein